MLDKFLLVAAVTIIFFSILYIIAILRKNNSIVDSFWGVGFIVVAIASLLTSVNFKFPQLLITFLVFMWAFRLSIRIFLKNKGKPEDWRYAKWRNEWGKHVLIRSYTDVFLLQAVFCLIISLPVFYVNTHQLKAKLPVIIALGLIIWLIGFVFESVGDSQLDEFTKSKRDKGKVLDTGLWRYTRHPNYFGEATQWWGIGIIVVGFSTSAWWTLIGPVTITFLLLKISGVPLLEKKMSKNPSYKDYMKKTNKFLPGLPKA